MNRSINLNVFVLSMLVQVLSFSITSKADSVASVQNKKIGTVEKVSCSLTYEYIDANGKPKSIGGQPAEVKVGEPIGILMKGFSYNVALVPLCAADGRCSEIYEIETQLSYKSSTAETKTEAEPFSIQHLSLKVGKVRMTSACGSL
ncbi:MAG TPA: hypothetical protein PLJ21_04575 [Pseudobdellovibrionaceae bacterium]|nr:hypothetical protein [Pseudobdellovibrionaceae bacterium]